MTDQEKVALVRQFYESFQALDSEGMIDCYHDDIGFSDPAFGELQGKSAKNMWRMLCDSQKGQAFDVEYSAIRISGNGVAAHWEATYIFSKTQRKVHNKIDAFFEFKDGKIIQHHDHFNLHRWAGQALGLQGKLLGWTRFFKKRLNAQTHQLLTKYEKRLEK